MFGRIFLSVAVAAAWMAAGASAAGLPEKPRRIVSLNLCSDELVLRLADRENVASVTWLSRDPESSNVVATAMQVPVNHGLAEEVIPLNPDLVIAGIHTTRIAVALLKRAHFPVVELGVPRSLDEVRDQIRRVAKAVGEPARGERLIASMDARLAGMAPTAQAPAPGALILNPNGFTAGAGSLVDEIIGAAGLTNLAPRLGVGDYAQIPLELVVTSRPDVLILNTRRDGPPSLATELLRHPILRKLPDRTRLVVLPSRLWLCGGPAIVEAVERLSHMATRPSAARAGE